jgi:hypothetical protein
MIKADINNRRSIKWKMIKSSSGSQTRLTPELVKIGKNLIYGFSIVAVFACLYFWLIIYLLFIG